MKDMKISEYVYNYSVRNKDYGHNIFKTEKKTAHRRASKSRPRYASGLACKKLQKMWQTKLSLCQRKRSRSTLPLCQHARKKSYHGLYFSQKPRQSQKSFGQLSKYPKNLRRNQHHQSRSVKAKGNIVEKRLCPSKWKPHPSLMVPLFLLQTCCNLIF